MRHLVDVCWNLLGLADSLFFLLSVMTIEAMQPSQQKRDVLVSSMSYMSIERRDSFGNKKAGIYKSRTVWHKFGFPLTPLHRQRKAEDQSASRRRSFFSVSISEVLAYSLASSTCLKDNRSLRASLDTIHITLWLGYRQ